MIDRAELQQEVAELTKVRDELMGENKALAKVSGCRIGKVTRRVGKDGKEYEGMSTTEAHSSAPSFHP